MPCANFQKRFLIQTIGCQNPLTHLMNACRCEIPRYGRNAGMAMMQITGIPVAWSWSVV